MSSFLQPIIFIKPSVPDNMEEKAAFAKNWLNMVCLSKNLWKLLMRRRLCTYTTYLVNIKLMKYYPLTLGHQKGSLPKDPWILVLHLHHHQKKLTIPTPEDVEGRRLTLRSSKSPSKNPSKSLSKSPSKSPSKSLSKSPSKSLSKSPSK